jgi:hypothetical protein
MYPKSGTCNLVKDAELSVMLQLVMMKIFSWLHRVGFNPRVIGVELSFSPGAINPPPHSSTQQPRSPMAYYC